MKQPKSSSNPKRPTLSIGRPVSVNWKWVAIVAVVVVLAVNSYTDAVNFGREFLDFLAKHPIGGK